MTVRRPRMPALFCAAWILGACAALPRLPATFPGSPAFHAFVIDADTGHALEDVIVVADWRLADASGADAGSLTMQEGVSDETGTFEIVALPPTPLPFGAAGAVVPRVTPDLLVFKAGYRWIALSDPATAAKDQNQSPALAQAREPAWNGKIIALQKFDGDLASYARHVGQAFRGTTACGYRKVPVIYMALFDVRERLLQLGIANEIVSIEQLEAQARGRDCGPVKPFFDDLR